MRFSTRHLLFIGVATSGIAFARPIVTMRAQQPPPTEIYFFSVAAKDVNKLAPRDPLTPIASVVNISNNPDYDNQPSFTPDGKSILFTSKRDGKQTDIYRYDIATKALTQLTHTPESEYSPTVLPDHQGFSVIRVEADNTQRLWRFDMDGSHPSLVLENVKPVGYQAWIDRTHVAVFVLGANREPATLQIADTVTGKVTVEATNIGRTLAMRPGRPNLTYVSKAKMPWTIEMLDPRPDLYGLHIPLPDGVEDFAWDPSAPGGRAVMAKGLKLVSVFPDSRGGGSSWRDFADLSGVGISNITRLAIHQRGDMFDVAFVAQPVIK